MWACCPFSKRLLHCYILYWGFCARTDCEAVDDVARRSPMIAHPCLTHALVLIMVVVLYPWCYMLLDEYSISVHQAHTQFTIHNQQWCLSGPHCSGPTVKSLSTTAHAVALCGCVANTALYTAGDGLLHMHNAGPQGSPEVSHVCITCVHCMCESTGITARTVG